MALAALSGLSITASANGDRQDDSTADTRLAEEQEQAKNKLTIAIANLKIAQKQAAAAAVEAIRQGTFDTVEKITKPITQEAEAAYQQALAEYQAVHTKIQAAQQKIIAQRFADHRTRIADACLTIDDARLTLEKAAQKQREIAAARAAQDAEEFASKLKQSAAEQAAATQKVTAAREAAAAERQRLAEKQLKREAAAGEAGVAKTDLSQPQTQPQNGKEGSAAMSVSSPIIPADASSASDLEQAKKALPNEEATINSNKNTGRFKRLLFRSAAVTAIVVIAAVGTILAVKNHRAILECGKNILEKCTDLATKAAVQKMIA